MGSSQSNNKENKPSHYTDSSINTISSQNESQSKHDTYTSQNSEARKDLDPDINTLKKGDTIGGKNLVKQKLGLRKTNNFQISNFDHLKFSQSDTVDPVIKSGEYNIDNNDTLQERGSNHTILPNGEQ